MLVVDVVIWHWKESVALLCVNLLDATSYGINHVEVNHAAAQAFVTIVELWAFVLQGILYRARNETTTITII